MNDQELKKLLTADPVDMAENHTRELATSDPDNKTTLLALALQIELSKKCESALTEMGDTTFSNKLARYQQVIASIGFVEVYDEAFTRPASHFATEPPLVEHLYVWANQATGCILVFDTWSYMDEGTRTTNVNGAKVHYTWRPNESGFAAPGVTESGGYDSEAHPDWRRDPQFYKEVDGEYQRTYPDDLFWAGSHDAREALCFNMRRLAEAGSFFPVWPKHRMCDTLFVGGNDWRDYNYTQAERDAMTTKQHERMRKMPPWVQNIVKNVMGEE